MKHEKMAGFLPRRQAQVLRYYKWHCDHFGCAPTYEEVALELGVSRPTAHEHVSVLIQKGYLQTIGGTSRKVVPR